MYPDLTRDHLGNGVSFPQYQGFTETVNVIIVIIVFLPVVTSITNNHGAAMIL